MSSKQSAYWPLWIPIPDHPKGGWWVVISKNTWAPINEGPWPGQEGRAIAYKRAAALCEPEFEVCVSIITHSTGFETRIWRVGGGDGVPPTYRLSGHSVDGRRVTAKNFVSAEAAAAYASNDRVRGGGGKVVGFVGYGPKYRPKKSLEQIERARRERGAL